MENQFQLTTIIAVYGAILATFSFVISFILAIHQLRKGRQELRVRVNIAYLPDLSNRKNSEPLVSLEAFNSGAGEITVTGYGFLHKDGSKSMVLYPYGIFFPSVIKERSSVIILYPTRALRQIIDKKNDNLGVFTR